MADSLRTKALARVKTNLEALLGAGYNFKAVAVERRSVDLPDQGTERVWIYTGDEDKDPGIAFGKLRCSIPVVVRYRRTDRDKSTQAETLEKMSADITKAMGDEFTIEDTNGMEVSVEVEEHLVVTNVAAPEGVLLDLIVEFELVYFHLKGDQTLG